MRYDTLIIGAGLSGLAAGIRLAYFEKRVCLLERHTTIGGLNSFYRLRNRNHDVGLHAITNYAKPGTRTGPLSKLLRQLRLSWDDFALCPQNESRVVFPGASLRFTNDPQVFTEQVAQQFPQQIDRFRALQQRIAEFNEHDLAGAEISARGVLGECLSDPLLVEMLLCPLMFYGSASAGDMDFRQFVIMYKSIFCEGFARPREGVRPILKQLVRKFKSLGGELRLRAGVRSVLADDGRAIGVVLDDGTIVEGETVVSSAGFVETMRLCDHQPEADRLTPAEVAPGEITFVESINTLNCQPADLGHNATIVFYNNEPDFRYENPASPCDLRSGIICSPNNFAYDSPLDEGTMRITALANKDYWMQLPEPEYVAEKQAWAEKMAAAAVQHVPDFRPAVIDVDAFTPRTIRKFTGHINGCVYGAPRKHWTGTTHLGNLFICGTDQGYLGIIGSMLSGITVANLHVLRQS